MVVPQFALVLIALVLAAWTLAAAWAVLAARGRLSRAEATQRLARRIGMGFSPFFATRQINIKHMDFVITADDGARRIDNQGAVGIVAITAI